MGGEVTRTLNDLASLPATAGARESAGIGAMNVQVAALSTMNAPQLRAEWRRLYRSNPPTKLSRDLLELGVTWRLQERALGGLSSTTKRQLDTLARTMATGSDLSKACAATLKPGARLIRDWGGQTHEVVVAEDGFVWRGETWRSLSAIARDITGAHWSGPRFFGLCKTKAAPGGRAEAGEGGR